MHSTPHPLTGKTVLLNEHCVPDHRDMVKPGREFEIEGWWDTLTGGSWMTATGNWAATHYAMRSAHGLPLDNEVVYGKIGNRGNIIHVSELGDVIEPKED